MSVFNRAAQFFAQSPTGQYDDVAELALKYLDATLRGDVKEAQEYLQAALDMENDT